MFFKKKITETPKRDTAERILSYRQFKKEKPARLYDLKKISTLINTFKSFLKKAQPKARLVQIFLIDHFYLVFKSAAHNHLRIIASKQHQGECCNIQFRSYSHLKAYQKKVRLFTFSTSSTLASILIVVLVFQIFFQLKSQGATFTFAQNSWVGGSSVSTASHPGDATGWNKYSSKDSQISAGVDLKLASNASTKGQTTDTDFLASNGGAALQTSDTDFNAGTNSNTAVSKNGSSANVQLSATPADAYTKLLLHGDGSGNTFVDSSASLKTVTANGAATQSTAQSKFGGSSMLFSGADGTYVSSPASTDWQLGSTWTIDTWIYPNAAYKTYNMLYSWVPSGWLQLYLDSSGQINVATNTQGSQAFTGAFVPLNQWSHIAIVSNAGTVTGYLNGVSIGSKTVTVPTGSIAAQIGWDGNGSRAFAGYMDEFRVSGGIARWTGNFTPPVNPYIDYYNSGTYTSSVINTGAASNFEKLNYSVQTPTNTSLTIDVRAGNTSTPDGTWTSWQTNVAKGGDISALNGKQYLQYRANLTTTDSLVTPALNDITFLYYPSLITFNQGVRMQASVLGTGAAASVQFPAQNAVGTRVDYATGTNPAGAAFDNVTNSVWISNYGANTVSKIDIFTGVKTDYAVSNNPLGVAFDNITNSIWVANYGTTTVSKVNIFTGTRTDYTVGTNPYYLAFDNVTNSIWVANYNAGGASTVSKVNINTGTKNDYAVGLGAAGVAFDSVTNSVWVTNNGSNSVSKVNINTGTKVDYPVGTGPRGIAFDNVTNSVWVVNYGTNNVSKVNIATGTRVDYAVGTGPAVAAFDSATNSIWVTNNNANTGTTISKVNINNGSASSYTVGTAPLNIAFDNVTNSVWSTNYASNNVSKVAVGTSFTSGVFISSVIDAGQKSNFATVGYNSTIPANTSVTMDFRAGNTAIPDGSWTSWQNNISNGGDISALAGNQYVQYRANLSTSNISVTPQFNDITFNYQYYPLADSKTVNLDMMEFANDTDAQNAYVSNGVSSFSSNYPPAYSYTYVKTTTEYPAYNLMGYNANNPTKSLTGGYDNNAWLSTNSTPQRFHMDLGSAKLISRIYYENFHNAGTENTRGAKNFTLWGSNSASDFNDTVYANNGTWTQIPTGATQFSQHVAANQADPKYMTVSSTAPYRYYAIKIADPWGAGDLIGLRRIELQSAALQTFSESSIKTQGSTSLKGYATKTISLNKTLTKTFGSPVNLSGLNLLHFDLRASRAGANIKIGLHDTGGTTTEITPNVVAADNWQTANWNLSGISDSNKDAIDQIIVTVSNADADNTFYIDNFQNNPLSVISSPYNTGSTSNVLAKLAWTENLPVGTNAQFQVRTSPDNATWTAWMGPDGTSSTFFTDSTGGEAIPVALRDGVNDQWMQYNTILSNSLGTNTPTVSLVNMQYVVNAPPEVRNVTASQGSDGVVTVNYDVRDPDTNTGFTPNKIATTLQYCTANCSNSGSETWADATAVTGNVGANVPVSEVAWSSGYNILWNVKTDYPNQFNTTNFKIRVKIDDSEGANNIVFSVGNTINLDTKDPVLGAVPIQVDGSVTPAALTFSATDDSALQMKVSLNSDLAGANWEAYNSSKTITLATNPDTVYVQFKDAFGNTTSILNASTPEMPDKVMVQDTSNVLVAPAETRLFIAWKKIAAPVSGFGSYKVYRSADQITWDLKATITDRLTNYFGDSDVTQGSDFYYRIIAEDAVGNRSKISAVVNGKADGVQNAGEGGGGIMYNPPIISAVNIDQIQQTSARINWTTDSLSNSTVGYSTSPGVFTSETGVGTMVSGADHFVTLSGLAPSTTYYVQVKSADATNALATDANGTNGYSFTTAAGDTTPPTISNVTVTNTTASTATITWNTNENSDSFVEYSKTNGFSSGALYGNAVMTQAHSVTVPSLEGNMTYYFKVHSKDLFNNDGVSSQGSFTTLPAGDVTAPRIIGRAISTSYNSARIFWDTDENATSYVEYGTTTGYGKIFGDSNLVMSHIVQLPYDLQPNTLYHYRARTKDASGNEAVDSDRTFTTDANPSDVTAPIISAVVVGSPSTDSVNVSWTTDENATSFVEYSIDGGSTFLSQGNRDLTVSHNVTLVGLTPASNYIMRIVSQDASHNQRIDDNGWMYYLVSTATGPQAPVITVSSVVNVSGLSATVTWTTDIDSDSFVEYGLDTSYGNTVGKNDSTKNHSVTIQNLVSPATYHFRVRSRNVTERVSGDSTFTTTADTAPPIISSISSTPLPTSATITWTTDENASSYIEYGPDTNYGKLYGIAGMTINHSVLLPQDLSYGTQYHYRILTSDAAGNQVISADQTFTTTANPNDTTAPIISNLVIGTPTTDSLNVTWDTDENSTSYIEYSLDGLNFLSQGSNTPTKNHSVDLIGLTPGTHYLLKVISTDGSTNTNSDDNAGSLYTFDTASGPQSPVISSAIVNVLATSATVTWTTDIDSDSFVEYGLDTSYGNTAGRNESTKNHSITIQNLISPSTYHFRIRSRGAVEAVSGDSIFVTTADITSSTISSILPQNITKNSARINWSTNENTDTLLYFGKTNYTNIKGDKDVLETVHIVDIAGLDPNTTYHYQIQSKDSSGNSVQSADLVFTTLPDNDNPTISDLTVQATTKDSAVLTWITDKDSSTKVIYSTDHNLDLNLQTLLFGQTHFVTLTGLDMGKKYYFKAVSADSYGNEESSGEQSFETSPDPLLNHDPLSSIDDIRQSIITDTKAVVSFTTDQSAKCFVEYGTATGSYTEIPVDETIFSTSHAIHLTGLIFKTPYFYKITCRDNLDNDKSSDEQTFTTLEKQIGESEVPGGIPDTTGPIIANVNVAKITGESVTITWDTDEKSNGLVRYGITGINENAAADSLVNSSSENYVVSHSVTIVGLVPGTKYLYKVSSLDTSGNITESSESSFTTSAPSSLSSVRVESLALGQATITWTTGNPTTSIVEYGKDTSYGNKKEQSSMTKDHSVSLSNLEAGTVYHFRVKGKDSDGMLYSSTDNTFEPKSPPVISNLSIGDVTENGATIQFDTDVPTDDLVIFTNQNDDKITGSQGNPTLSTKHLLKLENLDPGVTFLVKVRVRDEQGNETQKDAQNFTTGKDETAPRIERVKTDSALTQSDKVQTIISWSTNEESTTSLIYREGRNGDEKEIGLEGMTNNHILVITAFKAGTVYNFKVKSVDSSGNESISDNFAFLTPRRKENIIQIIIGNFQDIFKWAR